MIFRAPYAVGDTVYLDNTPFEITEVGALNVQLRDPALRYPVFRAESRENFERLLRRDERNAAITDYLPARNRNDDLRDLLMNGILTPDIRDEVRELFRQGEGNAAIGAYLSNIFAASDADTMTLEDGTEADFITSRSGFQAQVHGEKGIHALGLSWPDTAPVLRAAFLEEAQAQSRTQAQAEQTISVQEPEVSQPEQTPPEAAKPEQPQFTTETVAFYPGEKNHLPFDIEIQTIRTTEPEPPAPQKPPAENFCITDDNLGIGGAKAKFRANMAAINLLKELEFEGAQATPEQQEILSRYVGWGGLADAFDESKDNWKDEFAELYTALSPEEYAAARASTLNAHYTSPTVIKAIYEAVGTMGFQTGNILEPAMGVGNFFGLLPQEMQGSRLYGVELDSITGRIAKQLYPKADITVAGFETTDRRDFFDLAIGNVPFGQYQVNDRAYNKLGFSIHDYFFAKTLDQVRPGGVIAFVTSRYTMDKQSPEVRKYIAQRAELLGAIRLPNNAFKANAGTEVVSDILFLQKRDRPIDIEPDWVHLGENEDGFAINRYFLDNPEMVLGRQTSESTQYGRQDFTVAPIEGADLAAQLHAAVQSIGGEYRAAELPDLGENETIQDTIPADPNVKNYSYAVVDGEVYYRENSVMVKPNLNATAKERVKGMAELRDCVHRLIDLQMWESDDISIRAEQQKLNRLYDRFTEKYGLINSRGNALAFADDSSYYLLCSLEMLDDEDKTKLKGKADMFTKRTIRQRQSVTSVDTAAEALALSIGEKARVDMAYMSQLTGKSEDDIIDELNGVIFLDPVYGDWQTADEYLSGNVRQKLREAEKAAVDSPGYLPNVEALRAAQPKDLDASEIEVRLGATWIDKKYIQQFMFELLEPPLYARRSLEVNYSEFTAEWNISGKNSTPYNDINARMTYGTDCANAYKILEDTIYDDIREKLVARGIPREQIAFIHEANTEVRKKELFAKVRSGQVRVLMGSTFKMGAGMNVQDRLVALHDLDCPWRPGDLEQRSGRIIRQGNRNKEVHIYRYVTESTFDAYLWQTVENKQKFISQIMTSKSPVRSCEDIDEAALSYAEIKALCAGDERIREKMDLDVDVARLRLMKANHQSQQYRLEDNILRHFPAQIEENKGFLSGFEADMKTLEQHPHPKDGFAGMEVKGDFLTDKDNAGAAILEAFKDAKGLEPVPIGSYRGFSMSLTVENFGKDFILTLKGRMSHRVELGKDARGNLVRIDNALAQMPERYKTVQGRLENVQAQLATAKAELGKPFPQETELKEKSARLAELNAELNIDDRTPLEQAAENVVAKRPSVLGKLKAPCVHGAGDRKKSHEQEAR